MPNGDFFQEWVKDLNITELDQHLKKASAISLSSTISPHFVINGIPVPSSFLVANYSFRPFDLDWFKNKLSIFQFGTDLEKFNKVNETMKHLLESLHNYSKPEQIVTILSNFLSNPPATDDHSLDTLILHYLINGECPTRVGGKIARPALEKVSDEYLQILLDLGRIIMEKTFDDYLELKWLADDEEGKRKKFWEGKAGEFGNSVGGAAARPLSMVISSAISPLIKLPEEFGKFMGMIFGVSARKLAEYAMDKEIQAHSDSYPLLTP